MSRFSVASLAAASAMLPLSAALAGCGAPSLATVQSVKHWLVGQDAALLARCIGEPLAASVHGDAVTRVYSSAQARGPDGRLVAAPGPDDGAHARACVFEITARSGRITAVRSDNRAGWGFGSIQRCAAVVQRCEDHRANPFRALPPAMDADHTLKL